MRDGPPRPRRPPAAAAAAVELLLVLVVHGSEYPRGALHSPLYMERSGTLLGVAIIPQDEVLELSQAGNPTSNPRRRPGVRIDEEA